VRPGPSLEPAVVPDSDGEPHAALAAAAGADAVVFPFNHRAKPA